jgi:hypothetical protein
MSLKNPMTPPGIDPGTIRLVTQRLNHYANTSTGKPVSIKYYESVSVLLFIQHAKRMRHGHLRPVWLFNIFAHYLINSAIFGEIKVIEH